MNEKIILLHGFSPEEAKTLMAAVRGAAPGAKDAAFAMTTETTIGWKVGELMEHIAEEHQEFKAAMAARAAAGQKSST